jgi:hypothetical protein
MEDGTIPSTVVDSGCTLGVGTADNSCLRTGLGSDKGFVPPGGKIMSTTKIAEHPFAVWLPAQELHIMPSITDNFLSISKFVATNYITIYNKEEATIYDANDIITAVTMGAILSRWKDAKSNLWHTNTTSVIVNQPPTDILLERPPSTDAIHNVYKFKYTYTAQVLEEEVPTSSALWSGTLTSLLNTPLRSRLRLP